MEIEEFKTGLEVLTWWKTLLGARLSLRRSSGLQSEELKQQLAGMPLEG